MAFSPECKVALRGEEGSYVEASERQCIQFEACMLSCCPPGPCWGGGEAGAALRGHSLAWGGPLIRPWGLGRYDDFPSPSDFGEDAPL